MKIKTALKLDIFHVTMYSVLKRLQQYKIVNYNGAFAVISPDKKLPKCSAAFLKCSESSAYFLKSLVIFGLLRKLWKPSLFVDFATGPASGFSSGKILSADQPCSISAYISHSVFYFCGFNTFFIYIRIFWLSGMFRGCFEVFREFSRACFWGVRGSIPACSISSPVDQI